jgi:hypothetical protein
MVSQVPGRVGALKKGTLFLFSFLLLSSFSFKGISFPTRIFFSPIFAEEILKTGTPLLKTAPSSFPALISNLGQASNLLNVHTSRGYGFLGVQR